MSYLLLIKYIKNIKLFMVESHHQVYRKFKILILYYTTNRLKQLTVY